MIPIARKAVTQGLQPRISGWPFEAHVPLVTVTNPGGGGGAEGGRAMMSLLQAHGLLMEQTALLQEEPEQKNSLTE